MTAIKAWRTLRGQAIGLLLGLMLAGSACGAATPGDRIRFLDNGHIRIGIDLDLGGAITFLSRSGDDVNIVNSFDWGRQIQMSFYSGPHPFTPHGKTPNPAWAGLGWNPIQSGDCFGNRAHVIESHQDGKTLYVKSVPMQWPLDNEPGECTFETWITLEGDTAHVASRLTNHRADPTQYPACSQELPAVYTNGPWCRLMTYRGDRPFTGDALSEIPQVAPGSGFPWSSWQATENWAALVNKQGWGLGVWEPGLTHFLGGFAGKPGAGGAKDAPTGYIAPLFDEILDHNIVYGYHYDLILGSLDEIRRYVYAHAAKAAAPDYRFATDRQHWHYAHATDTGWPVRGELPIALDGSSPQLIGPDGFWQAAQAAKLSLVAAFQTQSAHAVLRWKTAADPTFDAAKSVTFPVIPDGRCRTYTVDLSASPMYRGAITGLRLDPEPVGRPGDFVRLRSVGFHKPKG